jgi:hypothetical protein
MVEKKIHVIGKGIERFMNDKFHTCKEILSSARNRLILGLISIGLGLGLVASAFIRTAM